MIEVAFWLSITLIVFTYAGFPLLVIVVGSLFPRRVMKQKITPSLSLVIAAYNEEREIAARLENALGSDYPAEMLEILVASDGSDDATDEIVRGYAQRGVRLLQLPRRGKIHALNAALELARGDIVVFSDADTVYERQALRNLARNFADPTIGGVAGRTVYYAPSGSESSVQGETLYWKYDSWLKKCESLTGSVVSAHGGMYAIRRELFQQLGDKAVTDDFAISTAVIERGFRLVYESKAVAYEATIPSAQHEFGRKVRIITQGLRGVALRRRLLNPFRHGFYSVVLFCHKVLRRLIPLLLIVLFIASLLAVAKGTLYVTAAAAQVLFYGIAFSGLGLRRTPLGRNKLLCIPFFYCMANAAALVALVKLVCGGRIEQWQPQRHAA